MAAERSGAGGAGSAAAAAAAAERPSFLSQSLSDRRAEVEAWSVDQADIFCAVIASRRLGLSGLQLWNISPAQIPSSLDPSFGPRIDAMRSAGRARLKPTERCLLNSAVQFVRDTSSVRLTAASTAAAAGAAAARAPSAPAAAAASSSSAAAAKRAADSSCDESPAKRVRFPNIGEDERNSNDESPEESRWAQTQYQRSQVHPAAAVSSASAAPSTALFRELPSSSNDPTPQTTPLRIDSLPQEWFIDPVPGELICSVCLDVARDPPNLEACGHAVCRDCLMKLRVQSTQPTNCPVCRQSFAHSKLTSQPFVQSMVWRLRVRCAQHDKGCEWQDQLGTDWRNLKVHDAVCPFKTATCPLCDKVCTAEEKADHPKFCPLRTVQCTSCQQRLYFCDLADHQPAIKSSASMDLTVDEGDAGPAAASASALSSSAAAAASGPSSSSSAGAAAGAAAAPSDLLPPLIPPCSASEACPRGCEDPQQPGHLCVYLGSQRQAHERTCTQRPVRCGLCLPASDHWLAPRHVSAHVAAVLADPQRRAPIQQQIAKLILHGYGGTFFQTPAPGAAAAAAAPGSVIHNTPSGFCSRRRPLLESFSKG